MTIKKISATSAILICLNTMLGAGLFINPGPLTQKAGPLGFLVYILAGILLLPIVLCVSSLAKIHPVSGGLYIYSKQYLSDRIGFLAAWSYLLAKTVSSVLILHKIVSYFSTRSCFLQSYPPLLLDYAALIAIMLLIIMGLTIGGRAQYLFISLKLIPIMFVFFIAIQTFTPLNFLDILPPITSLFELLPVAIFAITGFEIICGIGGLIENPEHNIRRAILIAFSIVITIATIFQLIFFGIMGASLGSQVEPLLGLSHQAIPHMPLLGNIINAFVFASLFGGVFAMLASCCWYIHTFGITGHLPFPRILSKVNHHNVPWVGVLIQGFLGMLIITITHEQVALQTMTVFALFMSYGITTIACFKARLNKIITDIPFIIPPLATLLCSYIIIICLQDIKKAGISFSFLGIFFTGIILELITTRYSKKQ